MIVTVVGSLAVAGARKIFASYFSLFSLQVPEPLPVLSGEPHDSLRMAPLLLTPPLGCGQRRIDHLFYSYRFVFSILHGTHLGSPAKKKDR
jgi:hypothetical protein